MDLLDALTLRLKAAAHPSYFATVGAQLPGVDNRLGVPMGIVRSAAKDILRSGSADAFLAEALRPGRLVVHETALVAGLVVCGLPTRDFAAKLELAERFLPAVTNWAICDTFATGFHEVRAHREEAFDFVASLCRRAGKTTDTIDNPERALWPTRVGLVLLLAHYAHADWLDRARELMADARPLAVARTTYYGSMGWAWTHQVLSVADSAGAADFLEGLVRSEKIDPLTARRSIRKIRESYRASAEEKEALVARFRPLLPARIEKDVPNRKPDL